MFTRNWNPQNGRPRADTSIVRCQVKGKINRIVRAFGKLLGFFFSSSLQFHAAELKSKKDLNEVHPLIDYTPPVYITLLFTDLGVLTPSAISDELIKLYC